MTDAALLACALSAWEGGAKRCRWCNAALAGRRQRWCSDECARAMGTNHWWNAARHEAKKRDGWKCVRCGRGENDRSLPPDERGLTVHHRDERAAGRHSQTSCAHHLSGVETLCQPCHKQEHSTPKSRGAGERRRWQRAQTQLGDVA